MPPLFQGKRVQSMGNLIKKGCIWNQNWKNWTKGGENNALSRRSVETTPLEVDREVVFMIYWRNFNHQRFKKIFLNFFFLGCK